VIRGIDVKAELAALTPLDGRRPDTSAAEVTAAFARLAPFRDGAIFLGAFSGESPWERHGGGDELVYVLDGRATLTIMMDDGPIACALTAGMVIVVPQGRWHRFDAPDGISVLSASPQPTEHRASL